MTEVKEASELNSSTRPWKETDSLKRRVKISIPKWAVALLILGLLGGGGYFGVQQFMMTQRQEFRRRIQTASVERTNLPVTIAANGTVKPERSINVSPKNSGVLKQLLVKEGDRIRQGQILAYMDDSNLRGQLTQAKGELANAQANLRLVLAGNRSEDIAKARSDVMKNEAQLLQAKSRLDLATSRVKRLQGPVSEGAVARDSLDEALTEERNAKDNIEQVRASLAVAREELAKQKNGSRPEEIDQARAQVLSAQGRLQTTQEQINDTIIRAPFAGVVTRKYADPGAFVAPTTAGSDVSSATSSSILALASQNQVTAKVAETNISQIKLGQSVTIRADAYPDKTFTGKVIQVAAQSTVDQNVTNFEVKASLSDPQNILRSGMNVNVDFNVGQLDNALVIPTVAIVRQDNSSGVMVLSDSKEGNRKRPRFRPISTGVTVRNKTVVRSGLSEGEQILLSFPPGSRPQQGMGPRMSPFGGGGGGGGGGLPRRVR
ncbi:MULTISPECIES: efflux RND transporter periplasmic adaptor subunit [Nostocales]|uniref:RND transporter n=3 Tax=Nostocales TaxID=1161 RepID=A0A0C1R125_9CYAN|nr:efflux RND transporter periplasmic adaptor subunit [Tolypothrix bouteillei]KAF3885233.1 efflux RND transporter periplasmic adaptor subunit [Tolypothrix bouteillei VB521301]